MYSKKIKHLMSNVLKLQQNVEIKTLLTDNIIW